jgi:hypothetical protein
MEIKLFLTVVLPVKRKVQNVRTIAVGAFEKRNLQYSKKII